MNITTSNKSTQHAFITLIFTILALIAFAANSVLGRLALAGNNIDSFSFTILRILSGAIMLGLLVLIKNKTTQRENTKIEGSLISALFLFAYALSFSIAYLTVETGTGALILFGAVQITMVGYQLFKGHKLNAIEWLGIVLAFTGFVYLVLPSLSTPSFEGFILMVVSGMAWAGYTIRGKACDDPLNDTAGNFIRALPLCLIVLLYIALTQYQVSPTGIILAITSGAITSGIGYAIWYIALKGLTATLAGIIQLLVPVIAALGGVIFVQEPITLSFVIASVMILSGILMITLQKN